MSEAISTVCFFCRLAVPWAIAAPIWLMGFPLISLTAALAVFFDCVPALRSGLGLVVPVLLWVAMMLLGVGRLFEVESAPHADLAGLSRAMVDIRGEMRAVGLDPTQGTTDLFEPSGGRMVARFAWSGVAWTAEDLLGRLAWTALALGIALASAVPFDRFGSARQLLGRRGGAKRRGRGAPKPAAQDESMPSLVLSGAAPAIPVRLTSIHERKPYARLGALVLGELRLMLGGRHAAWWLTGLGLLVATLVSPMRHVRYLLAPAAWLWPVLVWSTMGSREERFRTGSLVFPMNRPLRRQWLALWMAGVIVSIAVAAPAASRLFLSGEWALLPQRLAGALFVPALALALGSWTRSGRLFEIVYVLLWFAGLSGGVTPLDFMGMTPGAATGSHVLLYLAVTFVLLGISALGRRRRMRV